MDFGLNGKVAIVTGGSVGIGKAIARELALEGVDVAIAARRQDLLEQAASELSRETGRKVVPIVAGVICIIAKGATVDTLPSTSDNFLG